MAKNVKMTQKPQNGLLHSNYVFMPIWVEFSQNSNKTILNGQIRPKTSKWLLNLEMVYCTQILFLCPFESKSLETHLKRLKMVKYGLKRQNDQKNLKMVYCTQITFLCQFELKSLKTQLKRLKMIENVKITWKPQNGLLQSNYVFMPMWVEIAQNSTDSTQNGQIWPKTSKWPKKLKMVYCLQFAFLCPFESKSLKTQLNWLKVVKYGQEVKMTQKP